MQELKLNHTHDIEEMKIRHELKSLNVEKDQVVNRGQVQRTVS